MKKFSVRLFNYGWLFLVVVGIPSITSVRLGGVNLSSNEKFQVLTLGGLGIGLFLNVLGGCFLKAARRTCWNWAAAYLVILVIYFLVFKGRIEFGWLKESLLWIKGLFE
jgi:hypothetical protein